ncbi:hypothetical protein LJ739_17615 [Aestuariibacter halophilus]|uniref:Anti-sigma factor n=1 Tax=Fluctibacter halophilus TaxID=226011 RepID=A0ABS8GBX1_9ALTE|nr:hypothetical protein [Aestuariibacter halophilus]MCC2618077.1 hypothetical protein [Aestuariibacter halophilus]
MPRHDNETLLAAWLEGRLDDEQRTQFEQRCSEDAEFAAQVEMANLAVVEAEQYKPMSVPNWDRDSTFVAPERKRWWHWQGLPVASMAMSMVAMVMVVSGAQFTVDDGSVTLRFVSPMDSKVLTAMVDDKLATYQQSQQLALNDFATSMRQQQLDASTQLTNYLLTSSRQERREDFAEFIKFINQQRSDDQLFYARQLNKLQEQMYQDRPGDWAEPSSTNSINE